MAACKGAGITNFRFHDFRHTAITNMRRAGIDLLTIMQISGHKTMVCFTRYNSFREADLKAAACKANTYLTLACIIHDGSWRNRAVALRDGHAEPRGPEAHLNSTSTG